MSSPITETDTFPSSITEPDVNDTNYPAVIRQQGVDLASRTGYHQRSLHTGGSGVTEDFTANGQDPELVGITVPVSGRANVLRNLGINLHKRIRWISERVRGIGAAASPIRWCPIAQNADGAYWTVSASATSGVATPYVRQGTISGFWVVCSVPELPPNAVISNLQVQVSSPVTHSGTLPAVMPRIAIAGVDATGTAVEIASQVDTSANTTVYEALHTITVTLSTPVLPGLAYTLQVRGENGANSVADSFRVIRASIDAWYV